MMLAIAESSIGISGLSALFLVIRSSQGKTEKGAEDHLSFGSFNSKERILKGVKSVACKSLSNLEEEIATLGSSFPKSGFKPAGLRPLLRGTAVAPLFRTP